MTGRDSCVAKSLALHEIRSVVARVALQFDFEFAAGTEDDWKQFESKIQDAFTSVVPPLQMTFHER